MRFRAADAVMLLLATISGSAYCQTLPQAVKNLIDGAKQDKIGSGATLSPPAMPSPTPPNAPAVPFPPPSAVISSPPNSLSGPPPSPLIGSPPNSPSGSPPSPIPSSLQVLAIGGRKDIFNSSGRFFDYQGNANSELYSTSSARWSSQTPLLAPRISFAAQKLLTGEVLIAGGQTSRLSGSVNILTLTNTSELYNPASNSWRSTGSLSAPYANSAPTVLLDDGRVLISDGSNCELYEPTLGIWSSTGGLSQARNSPRMVKLDDGTVLIVGTAASNTNSTLCDLYSPTVGIWTPTGSLNIPRRGFALVKLLNGKVLVAGGGEEPNSAEIYDPSTKLWASTGNMEVPRSGFEMVLLSSGKVLAVGGDNGRILSGSTSAEIYDPSLGTWTTTGSLTIDRFQFQLVELPDRKVMAAGGTVVFPGEPLTTTASTEIWDPATGIWDLADEMSTPRTQFEMLSV